MDIVGKKVFITSCGGLGDLIVCTPALKRLKEKFKCHITFLCQEKYKDVLLGLPYIDKVVTIERGKFLGRYKCIFSGELYKQDCVIFTDWHPILLVACHLFKVPLVAGILRQGHKFSKFINKPIVNQVFEQIHYAALSNAMTYGMALDVVLDGNMDDIDVSLPSDNDVIAVDNMLQELNVGERYIVLSPFAALKERNYPVEQAKQLVKKIEAKYKVPVIVIGVKEDTQEAMIISEKVLTGKTSIMQMIQLIKKATLLISVDSGPMHIAGAVRTPCVALFSKDLPSRWAPRTKCVPIYLNYECSPCSDEAAKSCKYNVRCMRDITFEIVMENVEKLLQSNIHVCNGELKT